MRIISFNANGIRAAARKGFFEWLPEQQADVVCIQETKAQEHQLDKPEFRPDGHHCFYFDAERKGYSGVAIYARQEPDEVIRGLGEGFEEFDAEGRYIEARFGKLSVASLYLPSGSAGDHRQDSKWRFLEAFMPRMREMMADDREYILCGDWNIAHTKADIKNWRGNQKNSGFLPEERAWLDELFGDAGWVDAFRQIEQPEHSYTWWSHRGQAWANNTGWRIDYHVVTPGLGKQVERTAIYTDERLSDHAPLTIDYAGEIGDFR